MFEIIPLCVILNAIISFTFLLCEPGMIMTHQFVLFYEKLAECDWYTLPIQMQRMYIISLMETQNPITIHCYAGITCERDRSKKVNQYFANRHTIEISRFIFLMLLFSFSDN